jgi:HSP20 family protein
MNSFRPGLALPLDELRDELDRLWSSLTAAPPLHGWGVERREGVFPAVNVYETEPAIVIEAELPGLDVADIDISATAEEVVLKGQRPAAATPAGGNGEKGGTWLRRERGAGAFERRLPLPVAIDASRVGAKLVDGVLTVSCPKAPESQPHKIPVHAS